MADALVGDVTVAIDPADAFERYAGLVRQAEDVPALRINPAHSIAIARAWAEWRDLFLAADGAA